MYVIGNNGKTYKLVADLMFIFPHELQTLANDGEQSGNYTILLISADKLVYDYIILTPDNFLPHLIQIGSY